MIHTTQTSQRKRTAHDSDSENSDATPHTQSNNNNNNNNNNNSANNNKQTQSQSQAKGKRRAEPDNDSDSSEPQTSGGEGPNKKLKKKVLSDEERKQLVQAICRHAIFHEYNKRPLRREDITKSILTDGRGRHFNELIEMAQKVLKDVMGYELVQMRAKEGTGGKNPPKAYVLRSSVPPELLRHAATATVKGLGPVGETSASGARAETMLRDFNEWQAEKPATLMDHRQDETGTYGLLGVVLALILVNGKVLTDDQLISYLRRLSLSLSGSTPVSPLSAQPAPSLHALLLAFAKQGYLERNKSAMALAGATQMTQHQPTQRKKGRATQVEDEPIGGEAGDPGIEWRWGARAEIELGEKGVARFVKTIYEAGKRGGEGDDEEGEGGGGGREARSGRGATGEKLMTEITRASGSKDLQGVTVVEKVEGKERDKDRAR